MPTYEYRCSRCDHHFESFQKISAAPIEECPACGGPVKRLISSGAGIIVKSGAQARTACGSDVPCCGRGEPCGKSGDCK